jgi:hypothetical protein
MADLATQSVSKTGLDPNFVAASAGGDTLTPGPRTFLYVKNGHSSSQTVTINSQINCDQGVDHNVAVTVPNGDEQIIGPIESPRFARASDGKAEITYSGVVALTVAAITA